MKISELTAGRPWFGAWLRGELVEAQKENKALKKENEYLKRLIDEARIVEIGGDS